jgi:hypothetical protein
MSLEKRVYCLRCEDSLGAQVFVQVDFSERCLSNRSIMDLLLETVAILVRHL